MLQRNACVVLGNIGTDEDLAVLDAMLQHEEPIVREHAQWALAQWALTQRGADSSPSRSS